MYYIYAVLTRQCKKIFYCNKIVLISTCQVATRGATLYFVLADLSGIDIMYQFSLDWFKEMFITCIANPNADNPDATPHHPKLERRKSSIIGAVRAMRPRSRQGSVTTPTPRGSVVEALQETPKPENPEELRKHMLEMINRLVCILASYPHATHFGEDIVMLLSIWHLSFSASLVDLLKLVENKPFCASSSN